MSRAPEKKTPKSKKAKIASAAPQRRRSPDQASRSEGILDAGAKHDIAGVILIVLAVVLMLLAILPSDGALISNFASEWVHLVFGIGCYILPLFLLAIGITFLVDTRKAHVPARAAIGLAVVFTALISFVALFAPTSTLGTDNPNLLFGEPALVGYGGYVGNAIAWCGITLFGKVITGVILIGAMIVGLIVIGFSVSKLVASIRAKRRESSLEGSFGHLGASGSTGLARIRRDPPMTPQNDAYMRQIAMEVAAPDFDPSNTTALTPYASNEESDEMRMHTAGARIPITDDPDPSSTRRLVPIALDNDFDSIGESQIDTSKTRRLSDTPSLTRPLAKPSISGAGKDMTPSNAKRNAKGPGTGTLPTPQLGFTLPSMKLLNTSKRASHGRGSDTSLAKVAERLQGVLSDFGIDAHVVDWIAGPTVSLFEVDLPAGVRVSRVTALSDDIALALASPGVRIFAPVPGTNYVGIEVPNEKRETVLLADVLKDAPEGPLQIAIGKDVEGKSIVSDLARMPHLLIGGTTGSGKSVAINAMIMSILMRATPAEVRFIMIDPKRVEFTPYNGIPHLYVPVVTEPKEAASALAWGVAEMERRLKIFSKVGARNISQYNAKVQEKLALSSEEESREEEVVTSPSDEAIEDSLEEMPYIVIIIDELADLMMNIGKEVEMSISRIAQLARAAGIHLIVATQRPSTNVVTGLIKANITNRIAFNVASGIDSRVVIDSPGAESLIGLGDLLLSKPELAKPQRIQGCFVSEDEIERVVDFVKEQASPEYHDEILSTNAYSLGDTDPSGGSASGDRDPLLWEAADMVVSSGMGSTSNIQRRLKVGYARAGRIMDQLEELGIVGSANGSRPREVLVDETELETVKAFETSDGVR